jgi:hypothetical protein
MPKLTECAKYALCQFFVTAGDTSEEDYFATGVSIVRRDVQKNLLSGGIFIAIPCLNFNSS